jgi:hypothetical protein
MRISFLAVLLLTLTGTALRAETPASSPAGGPVLTTEQRAAAETALRDLRKLRSATQVGLVRADYQNRLIDTKADVDEQLRKLPEGEVKHEITDAMQVYVDTSTLWQCMIQSEYKRLFKKTAGYDVVLKYGLPWRNGNFRTKFSEADTQTYIPGLWKIAARLTDAIDLGSAPVQGVTGESKP